MCCYLTGHTAQHSVGAATVESDIVLNTDADELDAKFELLKSKEEWVAATQSVLAKRRACASLPTPRSLARVEVSEQTGLGCDVGGELARKG